LGQKKTVTQVSFGSSRGEDRCHAGIDIFTQTPGYVISIAEGEVVAINSSWTFCTHGWGVSQPGVSHNVSAGMAKPDLKNE